MNQHHLLRQHLAGTLSGEGLVDAVAENYANEGLLLKVKARDEEVVGELTKTELYEQALPAKESYDAMKALQALIETLLEDYAAKKKPSRLEAIA